MRIGLVIYGALDTLSGGYLYDRKLVEYLRSQGDAVEIVSLAWRDYARHLTDNTSLALERRLIETPVDVWLQDELNHPSLLRANRVMRLQGVHTPIVSIVHHLRISEVHPPLAKLFYRGVERAYLETCDGFVLNSQATRRTVESLLGAARPHVVAHPGGDHLALAPAVTRSNDEPLRLLAVGNLMPRKGLHITLAALARVSGDWTLDVIGRADVEPAYAAQCRAQAQRLGLGDRVRWLGRLDDAALAQAYAASDTMVVPSQYEGFGIVYLEAMAAGLPVIASTAGAAGEIVTDGVDGYLVPAEDAVALAAAIGRLFDRDLLTGLKRAARVRYQRHPTWAVSCAAIRQFLLSHERR
jgi:glycosyltransferase involved in cell wall biosynthesis